MVNSTRACAEQSAAPTATEPIAQPRLDQLSEQIGRSTPLCILEGAEIVYLALSGTSA